jgi:hypothetical protein
MLYAVCAKICAMLAVEAPTRENLARRVEQVQQRLGVLARARCEHGELEALAIAAEEIHQERALKHSACAKKKVRRGG